SSSSSSDDLRGKWSAIGENGKPCIMMYAQIDLLLSYITDDNDAVAEAGKITVPVDATTTHSTCMDTVEVADDTYVLSQVLQLDFPQNEGWNVRFAFTKGEPRMDISDEDYALYSVTVTANYSSMPKVFTHVAKDHMHTYHSVIDFAGDPPEIATEESTKLGDSIYCPSAQGFIINNDAHVGPSASITITKLLMQAYMTTDDFGPQITCSDDQTELDLVPVIVSAVLAGLVLFTLIAYFVYRSRLPSDILDMTQPEFEEDEDHHHHNHKEEEHSNLNHHDNYGYKEDEHRF
ncbi:hypothetical protein PFISCL1PPCAC_23585, partial [Pristionchus fissidentatus]